jgi:cytochrome P450
MATISPCSTFLIRRFGSTLRRSGLPLTPAGGRVPRWESRCCATRSAWALLRDSRLRHGSLDGLAAQGVTTGLFADWRRTMLLNLEGRPHQRQRRLVSKAFTQRGVEVLRPFMRATAHELIDGIAGNGSCEFMTAFADPYPAWVIAELLGIPTERFDAFLGWAINIGLGFSPAAAAEQDCIDAAVAALYACCDELIAQRRDNPGNDLISTLIAAQTDGEKLSTDELGILVNTLVFAGQDTTRNQLGLAMTTFAQHPRPVATTRAATRTGQHRRRGVDASQPGHPNDHPGGH